MKERDYAKRNREVLHFVVVPTALLTVALLGGLRVDATTKQLIFLPPPLVTLVLAVFLSASFVRAGAIDLQRWLAIDQPMITNIAHLLTLLTLFFASAQAFNSVLPENGLLHWMFSFFFLWTLWTNQFSAFDARRLLRSLTVLFGTAFLLKHLLVSNLYTSEGGWLGRVAATVLQGIAVTSPGFAPATGYISFLALALYVGALVMISPAAVQPAPNPVPELISEGEEFEKILEAPRSLKKPKSSD
jgi:hypothetical protein